MRWAGLMKKSSAQRNALSSSRGPGSSPCSRSALRELSWDRSYHTPGGRKPERQARMGLKKKKYNKVPVEICVRLWEPPCTSKGREAVGRVRIASGRTRRCSQLPRSEHRNTSKGASNGERNAGPGSSRKEQNKPRGWQQEGRCEDR